MSAVDPIFAPILEAIRSHHKRGDAKESQTRCLKHHWQRRGHAGDPTDPEDFVCTRCRITASELEVEMLELHATNAVLVDEINEETERADNAEAAAKLNAETIANQRRECANDIDSLHDRIRELESKIRARDNRIDELMRVQLELIDQKNRALDARDRAVRGRRGLQDDLEAAVVTVGNGHRRTLWDLYEAEDFEALCVCRDVNCDSDHVPDPREIAAEAAGDSCEEGV